jgi:malate dehydrogenase (oxaloacetate-decarboxylating)
MDLIFFEGRNQMNSFELHKALRGKIRVEIPMDFIDDENLSLLYTPGVGEIASACATNPDDTYIYTRRWNAVAIVSDGSAVLGLGDIGPYGALPVMEGKALLFKKFGNIDAVPICIDTHDPDEIVKIVKSLEPTFGGINLEDISAPRCFGILERLDREMNIPVFHDDQQGTAVVACAALKNSLKLVGKNIEDVKIVVNGIGAAGYNIVRFLLEMGGKNVIAVDRNGILNTNDPGTCLHEYHEKLAKITNPEGLSGDLKHAVKGADVFIGVSKAGLLDGKMVSSMNNNPIIFALANPVPEIYPAEAIEAGAFIVATGRSDFPNQINNLMAFPGIMKGALEGRRKINMNMLHCAIDAIADSCDPSPTCILPRAYDENVHMRVKKSVLETK